jgi:hypothetical protein
VHPKLKIVTQLPLRGLWADSGPVKASRRRPLSSTDVRDLLLETAVQFVVVEVGQKPRWIDLDDCYRFWMDEVQHRVTDPDSKLLSDQIVGVYSYGASEWQSEEITTPIVVLELGH